MIDNLRLFQRPFYFLRHGETELNANRLIAGLLDTDLTELGRQQAEDAAAILAQYPITGVYSSPLRRAYETAVPPAALLKLPVVIIAEIAERNWGALQGTPRALRTPGVTPEGAETFETFKKRVLFGLAQIDTAVPLIVGHSGVYRVLSHTLALVESETQVANGLPLRFEPHAAEGWKLVPLT